jgi:hypothetical protein
MNSFKNPMSLKIKSLSFLLSLMMSFTLNLNFGVTTAVAAAKVSLAGNYYSDTSQIYTISEKGTQYIWKVQPRTDLGDLVEAQDSAGFITIQKNGRLVGHWTGSNLGHPTTSLGYVEESLPNGNAKNIVWHFGLKLTRIQSTIPINVPNNNCQDPERKLCMQKITNKNPRPCFVACMDGFCREECRECLEQVSPEGEDCHSCFYNHVCL